MVTHLLLDLATRRGKSWFLFSFKIYRLHSEETQINFRIATLLTWRIFCSKLYLTPHEKPYMHTHLSLCCAHICFEHKLNVLVRVSRHVGSLLVCRMNVTQHRSLCQSHSNFNCIILIVLGIPFCCFFFLFSINIHLFRSAFMFMRFFRIHINSIVPIHRDTSICRNWLTKMFDYFKLPSISHYKFLLGLWGDGYGNHFNQIRLP